MMNNLHRFLNVGVRSHNAFKAWPALSLPSKFTTSQLVGSVRSMSSGEGALEKETADSSQYETLRVTFEEGIRTITFNRPEKKNALSEKMFEELPLALAEAAEDPETVITATTGAGNVYCAGNDRENFKTLPMTQMRDLLTMYFAAYIDFPKPLVAIVNGAAVGGAVTVLPLYDAVYAKESAIFFTPFSALDVTVEGTSSFTFPCLMGQAKASEILYFNKKIDAREAEKLSLVTEVLPNATFLQDVRLKLLAMARLPLKSLVYSKELSRQPIRDSLHESLTRCVAETPAALISTSYTYEDSVEDTKKTKDWEDVWDHYSRNYSMKPGDWECPNCKFNNFASRMACFKCRTPKDNESSPFGSGGHMGGGDGMRIGDWSCPKCQFHNFAYRGMCYKCNSPRGHRHSGAPSTGFRG